jgi:Calcineurin-like phosphoesterase
VFTFATIRPPEFSLAHCLFPGLCQLPISCAGLPPAESRLALSTSGFKFANPTFTADNFVTYSAQQIDADTSVPTSDEIQALEPIPKPRVSPPILPLANVLSQATVNAISATGELVIHCVGDTGGIERAEPQLAVADAMTADLAGKTWANGQPAFFYHLGDVVYFFGQETYYPEQFYEPYRNYPGPIFAIPGNHDGFMFKGEPAGYSCEAFVDNFCTAAPAQGAPGFDRTTMTQPGVYFTLDAPFVRIIGLYSNAGETVGSLGNSTIGTAQLTFLTSELKRYASDRKADTKNKNPQALVIAVHHPPFTGSSQHMPSAAMLKAMDTCCTQAGVWPDMVLSGHAHLYERYTRIMKSSGRQIPYIVSGNGGYYDLSGLKKNAQGKKPVAGQQQESDGAGNTITLDSYSDTQFGFLRITFNASSIAVQSVAVNTSARTDTTVPPTTSIIDSFTLNLASHTVSAAGATVSTASSSPSRASGAASQNPSPAGKRAQKPPASRPGKARRGK